MTIVEKGIFFIALTAIGSGFLVFVDDLAQMFHFYHEQFIFLISQFKPVFFYEYLIYILNKLLSIFTFYETVI